MEQLTADEALAITFEWPLNGEPPAESSFVPLDTYLDAVLSQIEGGSEEVLTSELQRLDEIMEVNKKRHSSLEGEYKDIIDSMRKTVAKEFREEKIPDAELLQMFYNNTSDMAVRDPVLQGQVAKELHTLVDALKADTRQTIPAATYDKVFLQYAQLASKYTVFPHLVLEAASGPTRGRAPSSNDGPVTPGALSLSFTDVVSTPATTLAGQLVEILGDHYRQLLLATRPQQKDERMNLIRKLSMLWSAAKVWRVFQHCRQTHLYELIPDVNVSSESYSVSFALLTKLGTHIVTQVQEDIRYLLTTFKNVAPFPALLGALYIDIYGRYASKLLEKGQKTLNNIVPVVTAMNKFKASLVDIVYHTGVHQFAIDFDKVFEPCFLTGRADMKDQLEGLFGRILHQEQRSFNEHDRYDAVSASPFAIGTKDNLIRLMSVVALNSSVSSLHVDSNPEGVISQSCQEIVTGLKQQIVPLMFVEMKAYTPTFCDVLQTHVRLFSDRLLRISANVPDYSPLRFLYIALNTGVYFRNFLAYCLQLFDNAQTLEEDDQIKFQSMISLMDDTIRSQTQQLIEIHTRQLCFVILPDIDKHDWGHWVAFMQNNRVSYALQMLQLHLRGLLYDLKRFCSSSLSSSIFDTVFAEGMTAAAARYLNIVPSKIRKVQYQADVLALVGMMQSLIPFANKHVPQMKHLCSCLVGCVASLTAPTTELIKFFETAIKKTALPQSYGTPKLADAYILPITFSPLVEIGPSLPATVPDWQQALGCGAFSSRQVLEMVRKRAEFRTAEYPPLTAEQTTEVNVLGALVDAFEKMLSK